MRSEMSTITKMVLGDFDITGRCSGNPVDVDYDAVCAEIQEHARKLPIIYTAFDGDHQQLGSHMRRLVLHNGAVPANPESVLGYKDTVMAHLDKRGVLMDDLAVLRGCDELWVFTDLPPEPASVQHLAEGVVIELLFFLKRRSQDRVRFVSPRGLIQGALGELTPYNFSYQETQDALLSTQRSGVLELANSRSRIDRELPPVLLYITDPLDFKYSGWLRERAYSGGRAPLIPYLAVELKDLEPSAASLEQIVTAWVRLCDLATYACVLPPMAHRRGPSALATLLERLWLRNRSGDTLQQKSWQEFAIPKAKAGALWAITEHEGRMTR